MQNEPDSPEHHRLRSEFIRKLVQRSCAKPPVGHFYDTRTPKNIVQFWHDHRQLPHDVEACVSSWTQWKKSGIKHRLFDKDDAKAFIADSLGTRHETAFDRCYHPAMQADYFRLCYLLVSGGLYVDADEVCVGSDIEFLFEDGRLKLQPLCYDISSDSMVNPSVFLGYGTDNPNWIFYFNNNPMAASHSHPIIERALSQATRLLELTGDDILPEIQSTTGPGNLSKSIFELFKLSEDLAESQLVVLKEWESIAVSQWPLSYRNDARNWRLSNQQRFDMEG